MPLRDHRLNAGLSQRGLAQRARVAPATIVRIEGGHGRPHPATRKRIADALGVAVLDVAEFQDGDRAAGAADETR